MSESETQGQIQALIEKINYYNKQYYQNHYSEISDYDFDMLVKELQVLEEQYPEFLSPYSPTQRVGGIINKSFKTLEHRIPMTSLSNNYSKEELFAFDKRVKKILKDYEYVSELKFDGVAISLIYKDGKLSQAITRGDGLKGDEVTENIKTISAIPLIINGKNVPDIFEVRGEVFLSHIRFKQLNKGIIEENKNRIKANKKPIPLLANPRNTTSGTLKLQDSSIVAKRKLTCYCYTLIVNDKSISSHLEGIELLKMWGFNISKHHHYCQNIEEVENYIDNWHSKRLELPFDIDGIVIKINNLEQQKLLGSTSKSPRWAIAYKYASQNTTTILKSVDYQLGRTGAITPVANLEPVILGGTTVKRASLHNYNEIERLNLCIGDTVYVEKGGEIIPKITSVNYSKRPSDAEPINFITHCPSCQTELVRFEDEVAHYCPNRYGCTPQMIRQVEHFIQRKAMDISFLGEKTIEQLFENNIIKTPVDLYELKIEQFLKLERFAEKSAQNLIKAIEESKNTRFKNLLYALGIRFVGITVAEKLAQHFPNLNSLQKATSEELENLEEIGHKTAQSLIDFFQEPKNQDFIDKLKKVGLKFNKINDSTTLGHKLGDQNFVVSGIFTNYSRDTIKQLIKDNGGKVLSSISKNTNYVLVGDKMGPSKKAKAEAFDIPIISENNFLEMIK